MIGDLVFLFFSRRCCCWLLFPVKKIHTTPRRIPPAPTENLPPAADTVQNNGYLALGDSYTIGQSVDSSSRFPAQTAAILAAQGLVFSRLDYLAVTGWTTADLMNAIQTRHPKGPYAAVSLLIGVNDQYQRHDTTGYRDRFAELLDSAVSLAGHQTNHVFVLSIPDYGVTPFGGNNSLISEQIDQFNFINKQVAEVYGVHYTDVTGISRGDGANADMVASDGLHPSGKQYTQWAMALAPVMSAALQ